MNLCVGSKSGGFFFFFFLLKIALLKLCAGLNLR